MVSSNFVCLLSRLSPWPKHRTPLSHLLKPKPSRAVQASGQHPFEMGRDCPEIARSRETHRERESDVVVSRVDGEIDLDGKSLLVFRQEGKPGDFGYPKLRPCIFPTRESEHMK